MTCLKILLDLRYQLELGMGEEAGREKKKEEKTLIVASIEATRLQPLDEGEKILVGPDA
ncbi:hypothetical protein WH47_08942 [Habropoda laboriosa]|uniref:Uncharacterized protein n=1 Tax=Habropoda laboriosa TaxID=597456 RepID=A0A0L7R6U7_9HYME|nr:hypothetical protein WH47_08942 [Habropoda laboriosa]